MLKRARGTACERHVVNVIAVLVSLAAPITGFPQTLNRAVELQLQDLGIRPCGRLLGTDTLNSLTGGLFTICDRGRAFPGAGPAVSTGGGATTPTTLPSVVQQRLRETRDEEKKPATRVSAASADAAGDAGNRRGFFIAAEGESLDRDVTTFEDGYKSDIQRLTIGADFQAGQRWIAGLALDAAQQKGDYDGGGTFEVKSYGLVGFGAFLPTDRTFVQFYGGYARNSSDRTRAATFTQFNSSNAVFFQSSGLPAADYDANQYTAGILGGYDFPVRNVTISPFVGIDWKRIEFNTYSETGNSGLELTFHDDKVSSLQSSVGLQASVALRPGSWVVVPQATIIWRHEFENDQRNVEVSFVGDTRAKRFTYQTENPDRDWGNVNIGVTAISPGGMQVFGNFRTLVGHSFFDSRAVTLGLRVPF